MHCSALLPLALAAGAVAAPWQHYPTWDRFGGGWDHGRHHGSSWNARPGHGYPVAGGFGHPGAGGPGYPEAGAQGGYPAATTGDSGPPAPPANSYPTKPATTAPSSEVSAAYQTPSSAAMAHPPSSSAPPAYPASTPAAASGGMGSPYSAAPAPPSPPVMSYPPVPSSYSAAPSSSSHSSSSSSSSMTSYSTSSSPAAAPTAPAATTSMSSYAEQSPGAGSAAAAAAAPTACSTQVTRPDNGPAIPSPTSSWDVARYWGGPSFPMWVTQDQAPEFDEGDDYVATHNRYRALHGACPMVLNETLQAQAQGYMADGNCPSGDPTAGSNWYGDSTNSGVISSALSSWYSERSNYTAMSDDYLCNSFEGTAKSDSGDGVSLQDTGHFTQMVWNSSTSVGCAISNSCSDDWHTQVLCLYYPAGNMAFTNNGVDWPMTLYNVFRPTS